MIIEQKDEVEDEENTKIKTRKKLKNKTINNNHRN